MSKPVMSFLPGNGQSCLGYEEASLINTLCLNERVLEKSKRMSRIEQKEARRKE